MSPTIEFSVPLHTVITLGFYVAAATYIIFSFIMYYHWNEYSVDTTVSRTTLIIYLLTTVPLMLVLGIMTLVI